MLRVLRRTCNGMDLFIATRRRGVHENDSLALDRTSFKMSIAMVTGSDVS